MPDVLVVTETQILATEGLKTTIITEGNQGPPGRDASAIPGGTGDISLEVVQASASAVWDITHNLGKYPSVTVVDSTGDEVEGDVSYVGLNSVRISFSSAFAGRVYFN